jgi:predicted nuclease of predicted toxin-antitoxin system
MTLLLDANVDLKFVPAREAAGHDVASVRHAIGGHAGDEDILSYAVRERRIVVTHDRDFGNLALHHGRPHAGIIYLRLRTGDALAIAHHINDVLQGHQVLFPALLVVTEGGVRVRR